MRYLILRCHPRDTLFIPHTHPDLQLLCPVTTIQVRRGPSRQRTRLIIPILPSFLFLPTSNLHTSNLSSHDHYHDHYVDIPPTLRSRLHLMQRPTTPPPSLHPLPDKIPRSPPSSYAYCSLEDITRMTSYASDSPLTTIHCGSEVEVTQGLLEGIIGIVAQIRTNGDTTLKVQQHLGWQINTCIVNASVLRLL
jgi:hypothetical protein